MFGAHLTVTPSIPFLMGDINDQVTHITFRNAKRFNESEMERGATKPTANSFQQNYLNWFFIGFSSDIARYDECC